MSVAARLNHGIARLAGGPRLPRRTVRVRLTLLYGGLFLVSGAVLVAITYVLFQQASVYTPPQLPRIPQTPAIRSLKLPQPAPGLPAPPGVTRGAPVALSQALPQLAQVQSQLARDRQLLFTVPRAAGLANRPVAQVLSPLAQDQRELAQGQRQLARAVNQLAQAVHEVGRAGTVEAAQRAADSRQLLINLLIALAIVAVLALLAGWVVAGRMLRPLRTITRTAQRISSASLHERLALDGPHDELKELGDTLDGLFGRLDAAFEAQRQFVANASHELRTPLARQRALIQVALADPEASYASLRAAHERVLASELHLEQTLDGLLALTRGQAGVERREPLDLAALASEVLPAREPQWVDLGLDVRATLEPAATAGDPRLVERLIANLIDNAIRHNTPGGDVEIATGTREEHVFVSVSNSGPTIPPDELQRLFRPFERLGPARTGNGNGNGNGLGLGLSIIQAIATAHHAQLSAHPRPHGGLAIEVWFPPAERSPLSSAAWTDRSP